MLAEVCEMISSEDTGASGSWAHSGAQDLLEEHENHLGQKII